MGKPHAMISAEGITIGLHPANSGDTGSGTTSIGFMVDDISEPQSLLNANQVKYKDEDGKSGHYLNFQDTDGTHLYFVQPKWR